MTRVVHLSAMRSSTRRVGQLALMRSPERCPQLPLDSALLTMGCLPLKKVPTFKTNVSTQPLCHGPQEPNNPGDSMTAVLTPTLTPEALVETLTWRYATKKFDAAKTIDAATWQALEEALVLSPSSYGLQPWKFLVVQDPALRAQLKEQSWGQGQVTDASHFVVFTHRTDLTEADI